MPTNVLQVMTNYGVLIYASLGLQGFRPLLLNACWTTFTIVGNIVTNPVSRRVGDAMKRGAVDAEREAAGDGNTRLGKILREAVAGTPRRFGGVAAADDGDLRGSKQCCVAMHEQ